MDMKNLRIELYLASEKTNAIAVKDYCLQIFKNKDLTEKVVTDTIIELSKAEVCLKSCAYESQSDVLFDLWQNVGTLCYELSMIYAKYKQ